MTDWFKLIHEMLWGKAPPYAGAVRDSYEELSDYGLTMGTLYIGRPGTGKTTSLARHIVEYFVRYPDRAIFVLDWSGSISDSILRLILRYPQEVKEKLLKRLVYDELGNPDWVIPLPEFSPVYETSTEDQVFRVANNLEKLAGTLVTGAPIVGGLPIKELGPHVFRLLTAIPNQASGGSFQVTEAKMLLTSEPIMDNAIDNYGGRVPEAKFYLENEFVNIQHKRDKDLRKYSLVSILGVVEPREARARLGTVTPGWTPKEAIEKGLMVIVDGARMINRRPTQHYLFTQAYSLIIAELNKRRPTDPNDLPVPLVLDEVYSLLSIPGMAEEVGWLAPLYRSRKLELYIVLQALSQLAKPLDRQIWSLGNIVCFALSDFDEAYHLAQQLFKYEAASIKLPSKTSQPILEPDRGQYLTIANKIQRMRRRECIVRRYLSEEEMDGYIRYIPKTKEAQQGDIGESISEVRDRLVQERAVKVSDALKVINQRTVDISGRTQKGASARPTM